ncbi:MAG: sensory rhodopsin transducer [Clostridia bacterium]
MDGKNSWFIVDGYRPFAQAGACDDYAGHECIMILNCNEQDAHCLIDVYYADRDPVLGIAYTAKAQRISAFRTGDEQALGGLKIPENLQYSLRITSDVGVIVQYGRMDVNQDNLAYIATLGYAQ